jgi:hypothetical protein
VTNKTRTPRKSYRITCGGCDNTWTGLTRAHCAACHHTFVGIGFFDRHRERESDGGAHCVDPATITTGHGDRLMFLRNDGIWHGPEATEEEIAQLRALRPPKDTSEVPLDPRTAGVIQINNVEFIADPDGPLQLIESSMQLRGGSDGPA